MARNTRREFIKQAAMGTAAFLAYPSSRVLGANDRIRIGLIGAGDRGHVDLRDVLALPNVECAGFADIFTDRQQQAREMFPKAHIFGDHEELLARDDIDAVIVASPLHLHARHFLDTLAAGKDLYSEKTMTWSIPEAEKCRAAAKKSDRVVQIGLQHESSGALVDTRAWIKQGIVGKVTQVESWMGRNTAHGHGQWVRPIPANCTPQNVRWDAFLNGRPEQPFDGNKFINWRFFWEFSGGNITENMVHQIAWIMSGLDLPAPTAAYQSGGVFSEKDGREVPDTIVVTLDFPNDLVVTWQSTFNNNHYGLCERLLGSDGTVEHTWGTNDMVTGNSAEATHYYPEKINRPTGAAFVGDTPNQNHMANWLDCIRTRKTPNASVEIGYRSAIAAHMANMSYRKKERVTLEMAMAAKPEY